MSDIGSVLDRIGEETLAISQEEAEEIGFVPSALSEPRGPFIGATMDAVKKPSDSGSLRRWSLKKVEKPAQSICVSSATMSGRQSKVNRG